MHEVLVNRLGGLSLPRKSEVRLTDRPDMTLDVYRGRKTTNQRQRKCQDLCEKTLACDRKVHCGESADHVLQPLIVEITEQSHNFKKTSTQT